MATDKSSVVCVHHANYEQLQQSASELVNKAITRRIFVQHLLSPCDQFHPSATSLGIKISPSQPEVPRWYCCSVSRPKETKKYCVKPTSLWQLGNPSKRQRQLETGFNKRKWGEGAFCQVKLTMHF